VRNDMGLANVEIMVPFVRTLGQAEAVVGMLAERGLKRASMGGSDGLRVIMMCEVRAMRFWQNVFSRISTACRSARTT